MLQSFQTFASQRRFPSFVEQLSAPTWYSVRFSGAFKYDEQQANLPPLISRCTQPDGTTKSETLCESSSHLSRRTFFSDPSARFSTQQKWWFIAQKSTSRRASWKSISKLTSYFRPPARPIASFMRTILSVSQSGRSHAVRNQNLIPELILMCLKCDYLPSTITQRSFDLRRLGKLNDANHFRHATNLSAS